MGKAENHLCNYEEPVFRPVDYHNYYHFLSTVDREEIQEAVARYESRQIGPMQGILSAIVVILYIVVAGVWAVLVRGMVRRTLAVVLIRLKPSGKKKRGCDDL